MDNFWGFTVYVFHIAYKIRQNVRQIYATRRKAIVVSKITSFTFHREKEQFNENIKN